MEDRLLEFQKLAGVSGPASMKGGNEDGDFLPQFSQRTRLLQQTINQVKYNNQEILRLKDKHREATTNDAEKKIADEINRLIDQNNVLSMTVKDQLAKLKEDVDESSKESPDEPETRMKVVSHQSLSSKFSEVLKEAQRVQLDYKTAVKEKLARQAKIYDNSLTADELEDIVNDPEGMAKLISSKMVGGSHTRIQNEVSDIQDKYRDIIKLEKSVEIVHQMFVDMSVLVQANSELITNIETNVNDAKNYVEKATTRLADGVDSHKKARKWQLATLFCIVLFIFILLGPVLRVLY